jgi:nitrite reductase/ring-hydroxylating ferredoxin subunit
VTDGARRVRAGRLQDVPAGRPGHVEVDGAPVVIVRAGDAVYACAGVCAHRGGPLAEGKLTGTRLACPWHGWMYDVRTGECVFPGRGARVATYPVRVEGDEVWLELPC